MKLVTFLPDKTQGEGTLHYIKCEDSFFLDYPASIYRWEGQYYGKMFDGSNKMKNIKTDYMYDISEMLGIELVCIKYLHDGEYVLLPTYNNTNLFLFLLDNDVSVFHFKTYILDDDVKFRFIDSVTKVGDYVYAIEDYKEIKKGEKYRITFKSNIHAFDLESIDGIPMNKPMNKIYLNKIITEYQHRKRVLQALI